MAGVYVTFENAIEEICYCTIGMVLNADEVKAKGEFQKVDLLNNKVDQKHSKKYLDGENLIREFAIDSIRYLEWGTERVPGKIRRVTIPELYDLPKIIVGMTSHFSYDRGAENGDGFYVPDSVRICVRWDAIGAVQRLETEARQMYELSKKQQRLLSGAKGKKVQIYEYAKEKASLAQTFDLRYLAAILGSPLGRRLLQFNNRDENIMTVSKGGRLPKSRIYPDDLKEFPIKVISPKEQQPFIQRVDYLIQANWDLSAFSQLGHRLKFAYDDQEPVIEINFLALFKSLNIPCWTFLNAEPQRFEVIGARNQPITKVKLKGNLLVNGRDELIHSHSPLVLAFLEQYLNYYEKRGLTWTHLLTEGKIPKTDADIQRLFAEEERLQAEIRHKIEEIRLTYQELDNMVSRLYES